MICPLCNGHRLFFFQGQLVPCPDCEGQGEIYCCDGLQEQTEKEAQSSAQPAANPSANTEKPAENN